MITIEEQIKILRNEIAAKQDELIELIVREQVENHVVRLHTEYRRAIRKVKQASES